MQTRCGCRSASKARFFPSDATGGDRHSSHVRLRCSSQEPPPPGGSRDGLRLARGKCQLWGLRLTSVSSLFQAPVGSIASTAERKFQCGGGGERGAPTLAPKLLLDRAHVAVAKAGTWPPRRRWAGAPSRKAVQGGPGAEGGECVSKQCRVVHEGSSRSRGLRTRLQGDAKSFQER